MENISGRSELLGLLELAERVARETGDFLATRPDVFDLSEKTSAVDFATQMDIAAEKMIVQAILSARPDDGIIGEEGSERIGTSGITWVIDPIDGTVNYFYGIPGWNVSIAAKNADGVLVGAVYSQRPILSGVGALGKVRISTVRKLPATIQLIYLWHFLQQDLHTIEPIA